MLGLQRHPNIQENEKFEEVMDPLRNVREASTRWIESLKKNIHLFTLFFEEIEILIIEVCLEAGYTY